MVEGHPIWRQLKRTPGFPGGGSVVKNHLPMQETRVRSLGQANPLEEGLTTPPVFLPGKSHGYSHGVTKLDATE